MRNRVPASVTFPVANLFLKSHHSTPFIHTSRTDLASNTVRLLINGKIGMRTLRMYRIRTNVRSVGFPPVSKTLPQAVKKIAETLKPEKIILFGSYAYGNPTPDSNVDLLVIMETDAKQTERYLAVSRVLTPREFPVDIIVKTPEEIKRALSDKRNFFIRDIVQKGKTLYAPKNRSRHLDRTRGG